MDRATFDKIMRGEYDFQPHIIDKDKNIPQWKPITPIAQKTAPPTSAGLPAQQSLPYDRYGYQKLSSGENAPRGSYMDYRNYQEKVNPVRNPPRAMTEDDPSIGDMAKAALDTVVYGTASKAAQLVTYGLNQQAKMGQEAEAARQELFSRMREGPLELTNENMELAGKSYAGLLPELLKNRDPTTRDWITQHFEENQKKGTELLMNGKSGPEQFITEGLIASGQMLGDAAISSVTGLPVSIYAGLTGGAQAGQQALDEGYSSDQAAAMMLGSGAISAGVESIGGFGGDLGEAVGKKLLNSGKVPQKIVNYVSKLSGNKLVELLGDAASEGGEEFLEYDLQRLYENLILDKDTPRDIKEQLYNTGIGAFAGGLYGTARQATDFLSSKPDKESGLQVEETQKTTNISDVQTDASELLRTNEPYQTAAGDVTVNEKARVMPSVKRFIASTLQSQGRIPQDQRRIGLWKVPESIADFVQKASGGKLDIRGKRFELDAYELWHEYKRHQNTKIEESRGQIPLTEESISRVVDVISEPELIEYLEDASNYNYNQASFAMAKDIGGQMLVVEAVGGKKNPSIVPKAIWHFTEKQWKQMMDSGLSIGEIIHKNTPKRLPSPEELAQNKMLRVTATTLAPNGGPVRTSETDSHSPRNIDTPSILSNGVGVNREYMPSGIEISGQDRPHLPRPIQTGDAVWMTQNGDYPVKITGYAGYRNGREYLSMEGSKTAIPRDEVYYPNEDRPRGFPYASELANRTQRGYTVDNKVNWPGGPREGPLGGNTMKGGIANGGAGQQTVGADGGRGRHEGYYSSGTDAVGMEAVREDLGAGFNAVREGGITRVETPKKGTAYEFREPREVDYTPRQNEIKQQAERDGMKVLFSDGPIKRTVNGRTVIFEEGGIYLGDGKMLLVGDGDSYRHELGHAIEELMPQQYGQYLDTIQSCFNMSSPEAVRYLQARIDDYRQFKPNFSTESIWRELANTIFNDPSAGDWPMLFSDWDAVVTATKQLEQDFRSYRDMQPLPANMMQQSKDVGGHREYTVKTSSKAERIQKRMERNFTEKMAHALSIPAQAKREQIAQTVSLMFKSLKENGKLTDREADMLFDVIYNNGVRVIDDYYNQYKPLKDELRMTRLQISDEDRADIPDFLQFRKAQFGKLNIVKANGVPIDSKYMELSERYPELFPEDITHPADQLQKIAEVVGGIQKTEISLDQYRGAEADMYKEFAKEEFDRALGELEQQAKQVRDYEEERAAKYTPQESEPVSLSQAKQAFQDTVELRKRADRVVSNVLLTEKDNIWVQRLLSGEATPNQIPVGLNKADILKVYGAKKPLQDATEQVERYKKQRREEYRNLAESVLENSDSWKEKNSGIAYERETMERNFRDIIPDADEAERMVDTYITPIHRGEAKSTRMKNEYRDRIRRLNLRTKKEYKIPVKLDSLTNSQAKLVDKIEPGLPVLLDVSESGLVQLYGEKKITEQQVRNCGANFDKISRAAQEFREIYNELLDRANDTLMENGYNPIERRKDYFPHFVEDAADDTLGKVAAKLGMEIQKDELPTSISGITDSFRPGKRWMPNALRRIGNATEYDALKGFDRYLEGASDIIYHTGNIQRLRALEDAIRYKYSDEGIKAEVDAARENPTLSEEQKRGAIEETYKRSTTKFPYLVRELRTYTNILAGKKHPGDREVEHEAGRRIYNVVKSLEGRVAANMVAANPGSALTNFIPLTQALGGVKTKNLLAGLKDTVKSYGTDDGYAAKSDFLTNRKGTDILSKTNLERVSDMASLPMQIIDDITSGAIARARYYENIENGMTEDAAITDSDKFTAGLMADRSKGATPTLFNKRNPVTKIFTMFQLEVNNQLSYILKDIPRDKKNKGALAIVAALTKMFIGAYLYNELYEKLTGRRAALDPISIVGDAVEDFSDEDVKNSQAIANLGKNVAEEIPFVGGLIGGGRLPTLSTVPDLTKILNVADSSLDGKKKAEILSKEGAKIAYYWLPPFGGGQLKKIVEGTGTVAAGGSYTYNNEGEKQLQFPVFNRSPLAYAQAATFGKYAIPTAQDYVEGGFRPLTARQTDVYDTLTDDGADARRVYQTLLDLQQAEAVKDMSGKTYKSKAEVQREKLSKEILTPSQKKYIDESLINDFMVIPQESDVDYSSAETFVISQLSKNQQEGFAKAKASGIDADTYAEVLQHAGKLEGDKDIYGDTIPGSKKKKVSEYINSLSLTYSQRMALMEALGYKP